MRALSTRANLSVISVEPAADTGRNDKVQTPLDHLRNAVWLVLLGLIALVVVISSMSSARAKPGSASDDEENGPLTPVPVMAEGPMTGPSKAPLPFVAAFPSTGGPRSFLSSREETAVVERARAEIDRVTIYDNTWMETSSYPNGDVPANRGACTDVIVRSLREIGVDLQQLVHDDILRDPRPYKLDSSDYNIDHRRVGTMYVFFQRQAMALTNDLHDKKAFRPGDIVFISFSSWIKGALPEHVGIISDKMGPRGYPMLIENGGPRPIEGDGLGRGKVVGHFRALQKR